MLRHSYLPIAALLFSYACSAGETTNTDAGNSNSPDAGIGNSADAGAADMGASGQMDSGVESTDPSLKLLRSYWLPTTNQSQNLFAVEVEITNPQKGVSQPLSSGLFALETKEGSGVAGTISSEETRGPQCPQDLVLLAGFSRTCTYLFDVPPSDNPRLISYTAQGGITIRSSEIPTCESATPEGLCSKGEFCEAGSCQALCAGTANEGVCVASDNRCQWGACVAACSSEERFGYCEQGGCWEGKCDDRCVPSPGSGTETCSTCLTDAGIMQSFKSYCSDDCIACLLGSPNTCACLANSVCRKVCVEDSR